MKELLVGINHVVITKQQNVTQQTLWSSFKTCVCSHSVPCLFSASLREWIGSNPWTQRGKVDVATAVNAPAVVQMVMELLEGGTTAATGEMPA